MMKLGSLLFENKWARPDLDEEFGEISDQMSDNILNLPGFTPEQVWQIAQKSKLVVLTDQLWSRMENTDSWDTTNEESAKALAMEYDRDIDRIIQGFKQETTMPAPIVVLKPDGIPYLVAGNTRLMTARAMAIRPMVLLIDLTK